MLAEGPGAHQEPVVRRPAGAGAVRGLQRLALQFDILPPDAALDGYRAVVVPETTRITAGLAARLGDFTAAGGALLVSGDAALGEDGSPVLPALGLAGAGAPLDHAFLRRAGDAAAFAEVMYEPSLPLVPAPGAETLYDLVAGYFPRTWDRFSGHDCTPVGTAGPAGAAVVVHGVTATTGAPSSPRSAGTQPRRTTGCWRRSSPASCPSGRSGRRARPIWRRWSSTRRSPGWSTC